MERLIDADVLLKKLEWLDEYDYIVFKDVKATIDETPTVKAIPIDKPFLKMRYGDYVVYNKKWLVDHLQTEWTILQGKEYQPSIPIEWLRSIMKKQLIFAMESEMEGTTTVQDGVIHCVSGALACQVLANVIELWEKENETNRCR